MDSLNDLAASIIAFFSVRASDAPADLEHPYGHGKIENISAGIQAMLIFFAALYIIYEAVDKILNPRPVQAIAFGLVVIGITAVVDVFVSRYLLKVASETDSAAIRADAYHLTTDVWTSIGVFLGLLIVWATGVQLFDSIVALGVAATILNVAFRLTIESTNMLLDIRLPEEEIKQLQHEVMSTPKVVGFHRLRARKVGSAREIDYHLILPSSMPVARAHIIAQEIEDRMQQRFPNTTVVTHIEPNTPDIIGEPNTTMRTHSARRKTQAPIVKNRRRGQQRLA